MEEADPNQRREVYRLVSNEAAHGFAKLGRNPRRYRALVISCSQGHELCSVYRSPVGLIIVGTLTAGKGQRAHFAITLSLAAYAELLDSAANKGPTNGPWTMSIVVTPKGTQTTQTGGRPIGTWPRVSHRKFSRHGHVFGVPNVDFHAGERAPAFPWAANREPWQLQFRCRCTQALITPEQIDPLIQNTGTRRVKVSELSGNEG